MSQKKALRCCAPVIVFLALYAADAHAQQAPSRRPISYDGPIIDVHLHTDPPASAVGKPNPVTGAPAARTPEELLAATLRECRTYNVVHAVLNGWPGTLDAWVQADPERFLAAPMILNDNTEPTIDVEALRDQIRRGQAAVLGEVLAQYAGMSPADPVLDPYWRLAEEMDVPVMVHMGTSFPGTAYSGYPAFRLSLGNPMLLEDVLVRYPRLRIWVAHGGLPWSREIFALMQQYPQLHMDVSTISWVGGMAGRGAFHEFLQAAIAQGFGKRILFGSDQMGWPDAIGLAIEGVDSAEFLTPEQKHDIFYGNAVRFLRLDGV
ncbi:MAG: amidohydrolase family protein [Longimicrobiales bacterium]